MNQALKSRPSSRGHWTHLAVGFDDATALLPAALKSEGFGVVTEIDMQATLKAKLGVETRRYRIFGACNPTLAMRALDTDPHVGLLLPCNVVLFEEKDGRVAFGVIDPMASIGTDARMSEVAREVGARLLRVSAALAGSVPVARTTGAGSVDAPSEWKISG